MRARYSAYAMGDNAFILATWHATTRPPAAVLEEDARGAGGQAQTRWLGLEIRRHEADGDAAIVEFIARFKTGGRAERLHEVSRFVREAGAWWYVDGSFPAAVSRASKGVGSATGVGAGVAAGTSAEIARTRADGSGSKAKRNTAERNAAERNTAGHQTGSNTEITEKAKA